ncbi:hypothetical protein [Rubritalea tangerina]|uniref:hypothetical protein n=1 Tax=Rubritalea tangerina TaxID=430798 RepID=UPI003620F356
MVGVSRCEVHSRRARPSEYGYRVGRIEVDERIDEFLTHLSLILSLLFLGHEEKRVEQKAGDPHWATADQGCHSGIVGVLGYWGDACA